MEQDSNFRSANEESFSTKTEYLNRWLRRVHSRQDAMAFDDHESEDSDAHQSPHMFLDDAQPGPSFTQPTCSVSPSFEAQTSYRSSLNPQYRQHSPSSVDRSSEDDEPGFLVADLVSNSLSTADATPTGAPFHRPRMRDGVRSPANNMQCIEQHADGRIQQPISDSLTRVESRPHAEDSGKDVDCQVCLDRSRNQPEHKVDSCFICRTTDMAQWIGDPDGLPLCIVCANLYYVRRLSPNV